MTDSHLETIRELARAPDRPEAEITEITLRAALAETVAEIDRLHGLLDKRDASWLVKDFNVLYRRALDVSESDPRPTDECTPPMRNLRAQLERLRPAFTGTEEVRQDLRERRG